MNPNAKVPVLVLDDGRYLWESNTILNYLAEGSVWLPTDAFERAKVLQWQSFEQYSYEPYIAVARTINLYLGLPEARKDEYYAKQEGGHKALKIMDEHLSCHSFFVDERATIADISLYAYTHVADEGGFNLSSYSNILRWLKDFQWLPDYISMQ